MSNRETGLGTLIIVVLKARNLNDNHSFYKQDVFAQVSLNGVTKRTHVDVKGGQHPEWDAEIRFPVMKQSQDKFRKLEVACFSKEPKSDDLLGKGTVDIADTLKTGEFDDWVGLNVEGVVRGDLYLEMTFFSNTPAPATSLAPPSSTLNRRPSKFSPSERLSRPPHPSAPSTVLQNLLSDNTKKDQGLRSNAPGSHSQHLAPSPPSSRSSSAASIKRADSPLPPLPEGQIPAVVTIPLPSTLLPGGGRPRPPQNLAPHDATRLPATLRSGPGIHVASQAAITSAHVQHSSSPASAPRGEYFTTPGYAAYTPGGTQPNAFYTGTVPSTNPTPTPTYYAPPPPPDASHLWTSPSTPYTWTSQGAAAGPLSFRVPPVAPAQGGINYPPSYATFEPQLPPFQPAATSDLPDPYLQVRYQTPLPLPPGSTSPPLGRQPLPPRENPDQARIEALRQIEEDATRRKTQEEKDLALAMQLDRELNLEESSQLPSDGNASNTMPGGW